MSIAATLARFLRAHHVGYQLIWHERTQNLMQAAKVASVPYAQFAQTILLRDKKGMIAAVLPLNAKLDLSALKRFLKRDLSLVAKAQTARLFKDCEPGSYPPFPEAYGILTVVEQSLFRHNHVYFEPGIHTVIARLAQDDFRFLMSNTLKAPITLPLQDPQGNNDWEKDDAPKLSSQPFSTISQVAKQIIEFAQAKERDPQALSKVLDDDPFIAQGLAQFARKANQPLGEQSVSDSISKILDFDTVSHIAMGCEKTKQLQVTHDGPLGLGSFWAHALNASQACYDLAKLIQKNLNPAHAYLAGLFQNIGFLLFGHLYEAEFRLLNRWVNLYPKQPITLLEQRLLGLGQAQQSRFSHCEMGAWLLKKWGLPIEVITAIQYHHDEAYQGAFCEYVILLQSVNRCLLEFGLGEGQAPFDWAQCAAKLQVNQKTVFEICKQIVLNQPEIAQYKSIK